MAWVVLGLLLLVVALDVYVRLAPLPPVAGFRADAGQGPGDRAGDNWFEAVRAVDDPAGAVARLAAAIEATPRTERLPSAGSEVAVVTRSALWGFPDISTVSAGDGVVRLYGRSVFGRGDAGVNRRRLEGWLAAAGL